MNLLGACISEHLINFSTGGCPNDGIIHSDNSLAFEQFFYWIQLDLNTEMANSLLGFDERSSYVVISYHPELQGDFRFSRITLGGWESRSWNRNDHIHVYRRFLGELSSK